jgi:lipase chaperone LimK
MTTITLDEKVINEIIAVGHYRNAQEAVINILTDYVRQHKQELSLFDQLRLNADAADDQLAALFERNRDTGRNIEL